MAEGGGQEAGYGHYADGINRNYGPMDRGYDVLSTPSHEGGGGVNTFTTPARFKQHSEDMYSCNKRGRGSGGDKSPPRVSHSVKPSTSCILESPHLSAVMVAEAAVVREEMTADMSSKHYNYNTGGGLTSSFMLDGVDVPQTIADREAVSTKKGVDVHGVSIGPAGGGAKGGGGESYAIENDISVISTCDSVVSHARPYGGGLFLGFGTNQIIATSVNLRDDNANNSTCGTVSAPLSVPRDSYVKGRSSERARERGNVANHVVQCCINEVNEDSVVVEEGGESLWVQASTSEGEV
jgi:hypothetical protein